MDIGPPNYLRTWRGGGCRAGQSFNAGLSVVQLIGHEALRATPRLAGASRSCTTRVRNMRSLTAVVFYYRIYFITSPRLYFDSPDHCPPRRSLSGTLPQAHGARARPAESNMSQVGFCALNVRPPLKPIPAIQSGPQSQSFCFLRPCPRCGSSS